MPGPKGSIEVGSAYILITPEMDQAALKAELERAQKEIAKFSGDREKLAKQTANLEAKLQAWVTSQYGEEAAKRVEAEKNAMEARKKLSKSETASYLKALAAETAAQDKELAEREKRQAAFAKYVEQSNARIASAERTEIAASAKAVMTAEKEKAAEQARQAKIRETQISTLSKLVIRQASQEATAQKAAAREAQTAYTQAYNTRKAQILSQMETQRRADVAAAEGALKTAQAQKAAALSTIRQNNATVRAIQSNASKVDKSWGKATKSMGDKMSAYGRSMSEFGHTITRNLVTPLMAAAGAMSYLGISAADSMVQAQTALQRMGISNKDTAKQLNTLKNYGTATPYSVEDMLTYGTQYARAGKAHGMSSKAASKRATDLVQAIGNLSAFAGITDPQQVSRAMYAVSIMQDADRASLRNVKSLADNAGIPIEELASSFGFSDRKYTKKETKAKLDQQKQKGIHIALPKEYTASAQMMDWMANAKTTGGVPGEGVVDALLKRAKNPAIAGAAVSQGSSTIGTRLSNMYEQAKYGLAGLFIKPDKNGTYQWSGAGEALMGKKHVDNRKYIQDGVGPGGVEKYKKNPNYGKTTYQGGLLNTVSNLSKDLAPSAGKVVKELFKDLTIFAGWVKDVVKVLKDNPGLTNLVIKAGKLAALVGGAAIVFGGVIKIFGGLLKIGSPFAKAAQGLFKLGKGGFKIAGQTLEGLLGGRAGTTAGSSYLERYRNARSGVNGGDSRNLRQRAVDRVRGNNRQVDQINVNTSEAQRSVQELDGKIADLKAHILDLKGENLKALADEFAGNETSLKAKAEQAAKAVRDAETAVRNLRALQLQGLDDEFKKVTEKDDSFKTSVNHAKTAVNELNDKNLNHVSDEFKGAKSKTDGLTSAAKGSIKQVNKLNALALTALKGEVFNVKEEIDATTKKLATGDNSLIHRVGQLNGMNTDKIVEQIKKLQQKIKDTAGEAEILNSRLNSIANHSGGGGGGGGHSKTEPPKKKPKHGKLATGGILPGYTPGKDVHRFYSPTGGLLDLSGGESVMRPEWTAAMGHDYVNHMNLIARTKGIGGIRKAMKFAGGGVIGKLGLGKLVEMAKNQNIYSDVLGALSTMTMDSSSDALGGDLTHGVVGAGTSGSHFIGSNMAEKFKGMYSFLSKDSWDILKKLPIPDGYSQLIGTIGGMIGPVAGPLAWDDIWKGKGNILERGSKFANDLMSPKALEKAVENLFTGGWDSIKSLFSGAKSLLTDPAGFVSDGIHGVWDLVTSEYDGVIDMVKSLREIWQNPGDYASQVVGDIYSTAKDALPNLKGLFDFSGSHVKGNAPDVSKLVDKQLSSPSGTGSSVSRWTPQVKMALAQLGLSPSNLALVLHRIGVESGGNPRAINLTDSNAKAGYPSQGLMQTIPQTFKAYAGPYLSRGINDPLASIYAGLNYAVHRYGSGWQKALSGIRGYATGTQGAAKGWAWVGERGPELVRFGGGETVLNHGDSMLAAGHTRRGYASGTGTRTTGVAADAEKGVSSLNAAVKKLYEIITKAFTSGRIGSGSANSLNKWLDKENKTLQKIVKDRTDLAPKLKDANSKLAAIKKSEADMASSISDKAVGLRSLTDVFNADGVSSSSALSSLRERLAAIKSFQSDISALVKKGFSKEIISEIAQAGPEQGDAMARALLQSTSSQVTDINNTYKAIGDASNSLGKSVAGSYYKAGEAAAQSLVDGLTAKDSKLKKQIEGIADTITKTLKSKLHFNSKTPVNSGLAALLTYLTGESQAVSGKAPKKPTTRVTTSYSTDSKGRKVVTVTTTTTDPNKGTTTSTTERTVGGKTTTTTRVSKIKGYATGTRSASPGIALVGERGPELINFGGGERVYNAKETAAMAGPKYEIHVHEAKAENTTQSVLRAMKYAETMAAL
jgi:SLT domain-containing protein